MLSFHKTALAVALLSASLMVGGVARVASAQESSSRRVKSKVTPQYPQLARKMNVSGKVRLSVTVSPSGEVVKSEVLGGNPVLANAAQDAVKKWKYEPGSQASEVIVEFDFSSIGG